MTLSEVAYLNEQQLSDPRGTYRLQELLRNLREQYAHAEALAKEVSNFSGDVVIPVHNELRNAGFHLLQSLNDDGQVSRPDDLKLALDHCERAAYDAAEAGVIFARDRVKQILASYNDIAISDVIQNIAKIRGIIRSADEVLQNGRSTGAFSASDVIVHYRDLRSTFCTPTTRPRPDRRRPPHSALRDRPPRHRRPRGVRR